MTSKVYSNLQTYFLNMRYCIAVHSVALVLVLAVFTINAQSAAIPPSDKCYVLRQSLYDPLGRDKTRIAFERELREVLATSEGRECSVHLKMFWASALSTDFMDYAGANEYIDSVLAVTLYDLEAPLVQTLTVQRASNLSDQLQRDSAKAVIEPLLPYIDDGALNLTDTTYYYILSAVLAEVDLYEYSSTVLHQMAEKYGSRLGHVFRFNLHLLYNATVTKTYSSGIEIFEEALPLADTSKLHVRMISAFYMLGANAYLHYGRAEEAYKYAKLSSAITEEKYYLEYVSGLTTALIAAARIDTMQPDELVTQLERIVADDNETSLIREGASKALLEYGLRKDWPVTRLRSIYNIYNALEDSGAETAEEEKQILLEARHIISLSELGDPQYLEDFKDIIAGYESSNIKYSQRLTTEYATKYKAQARRDSIALLQTINASEKATSTNRFRLLLLAALAALLLLFGLLWTNRLNKQLKVAGAEVAEKNKAITTQNEYISKLNREVNHRATNNLTQVIRLLRDQRDRAIANGADTSMADAIERQILAYTKLQHLLKADLTEVDLKNYLTSFCEGLRESFAAGSQPVQFDLKLAPVDVHPDFAAPLALIINELATNSLKYAQREDGVLKLSLETKLEEGNELRIQYRDGGEMVVEEKGHHSSNQGMELIKGFTWELEGALIKYGNDTFDYEAVFPLAV